MSSGSIRHLEFKIQLQTANDGDGDFTVECVKMTISLSGAVDLPRGRKSALCVTGLQYHFCLVDEMWFIKRCKFR